MQVIDPVAPTKRALGLEELVRNFQKQQRRLELSPETIRSYDSPLQQFVRYMAAHGITTTGQLTRPLLSAWQESLTLVGVDLARGHLQPATRSLYSTYCAPTARLRRRRGAGRPPAHAGHRPREG